MPAAPDPFIARRMRAQRLSAPMPADPAAVVAWFGAVQAQDYAGAKWALTLRAPDLTDALLDQALADGTIIRTHGPRPTWHFIAPADIRWVLTAVAPRVQLRSRVMYRTYEIDEAVMVRARRVVEQTLGGGRFATRAAIGKALAAKGIAASAANGPARTRLKSATRSPDNGPVSGGFPAGDDTPPILPSTGPSGRTVVLSKT